MIFRPIYYLRPYFSLSLSLIVVIQIRGHIAGSPHPLPTTVRALHFYHDKISALSSRVDSGRIVHPSYCTAVGALSSISCLFFLRNSSKSHHGGIRMHRPTLLIIIVYSVTEREALFWGLRPWLKWISLCLEHCGSSWPQALGLCMRRKSRFLSKCQELPTWW